MSAALPTRRSAQRIVGLVRLVVLALVATMLSLGVAGAASATPTAKAADPGPRLGPSKLIKGIDPDAPVNAVIKGLVYDQEGQLLDNIQVEAFSSEDPGADPVASDLTYEYEDTASHGAYELHVPAGEYLVRFSSPDFDDTVYETVYYGGDAGSPVAVADAATVALDDVVLSLDSGAPVTGTVLGTNGQPLAGAYVQLVRMYADGDYGYLDDTETNSAGQYSFHGVNRGRAYTVVASYYWEDDDDWVYLPSMFLGQQPVAPLAQTFTLPTGSAGTTLASISLRAAVAVTGHVTGPTGAAVRYPEIAAYVVGPDGELYDRGWWEGNDDGSFLTSLVPGFSYTFSADGRSGATYLGNVTDPSNAQSFALGDTAYDVGTIQTGLTGSTVTVSVLDAEGDPLNGQAVRIWRKKGADFVKVGYAYGNGDGTYQQRLDWGSQYTFELLGETGTSYFLGGATTIAGAHTVTPTQAVPTLDAGTITLPDAVPSKLRGRVEADGGPLAGAAVVLWGHLTGCVPDDDENCWRFVDDSTSNAAGSYQFRISAKKAQRYELFTVSAGDESNGYPRTFAGGVPTVDAAATYGAPAAGTSTSVATITLALPAYTVRGAIVPDGASFDGDGHVELYCWVPDGDDGSWDYIESAYTSTGRYSVSAGHAYDACLVNVRYYDNDSYRSWRGSSTGGTWPTDPTNAPGVFAVTEAPVTVPAITVHPPSSISGTISTVDGKPLGAGEFSATLYRWDSDFGEWSSSTFRWTESPSYSFDDVSAGTYAVRVSYYPYAGSTPYKTTWSGLGGEPAGPGAPGTVTISNVATSETLDVALGFGPQIRGTVVDANGPVAGAKVVAYQRWCGSCLDRIASTTTDANGAYSLDPSAGYYWGTFVIKASKASSGYSDTYVGGVEDPAEATGLHLASGGDTIVDPITLGLRPGTLTGTLTTSDGGSLDDTSTTVNLYRWDGESFQYLRYVTSDDGEPFTVTGLEPGTYMTTAQNTSHDGDPRYAMSFYGGAPATSDTDSAHVFTVAAGTNPTPITVRLERGVALSGVVSTPAGAGKLPVEGAYVSVLGDLPSGWGTYLSVSSGTDGSYRLRLPVDYRVTWVSTNRSGFEPTSASSSTPPLVEMAGADRTYDISLTPDWNGIGSAAGEKDPSCLVRQDDTIQFDGRSFFASDGRITADDDYYFSNPLDGQNTQAVLAPLSKADTTWSPYTWGVSDGTLCVQWLSSYDGGSTYQVRMSKAAGGGYDVVYNYDTVPSTPSSTRAGYADGQRSFGQSVVFPGAGSGYADGGANALISHSLGSEVPGRYAFHFDGFPELETAPYASIFINGTRGPGGTLTGSTTWRLYDEETDESTDVAPEDIELHYRWHRGTTTLGTGPTYDVLDSDFGQKVRLTVEARLAGHEIGVASTRVSINQGAAAATNVTPPSLSPAAPAVGGTVTLDPGVWTPAAGLTDSDLHYEYQWFRGTSRLEDEDGSQYVTTSADAGRTIRARVVVTSPNHGTVSADTAPVTVAELPLLVATTTPTISGTAKVGQQLVVDPGAWDESGPMPTPGALSASVVSGVTYSYQWYAGWRQRSADAGSGGTRYTPTTSDRGELITVTVTANAPGHRSGKASSTVGPVVAADAVTRTLTIHVVDEATDDPVEGAYVYACENVEWTCLTAGVTNASGDYTASALADRDYAVSVYPSSPYRSASANVTASGSATITVELTKPTPPPANVTIPTSNGSYDGTPMVYWQEAQDFNVSGCATTANPTYTVKFSDGTPQRTGALVKGTVTGDLATFHATIPAFYPSHGDTTIETTVPANCAPGTPPTKINIYIDPSGIVTDQYGRAIEGATVTLQRSDNPGGPFTAVPDGSDIMSPANRQNPSTTDSIGFFQWDVTEGWYRVKAESTGCTATTTDAMEVPPIRIDLLIKLQCTGATAPSAAPVVTGTAAIGQTLSTDPDIWGTLDEVSVQWLRDGAPIGGADDATYQVTEADAGHAISVQQTARRSQYTQEAGHGAPVSFKEAIATSPAKQVVGDAPSVTSPPALAGSGKVGSTLTATAPTWSRDGTTSTPRWYAGNDVIAGASGLTYQPTAADLGKAVKVTFTGTKPGYADATTTTGTITVVTGDAPTAAGAAIAGSGKVGSTLTATAPTWSRDGTTSTARWYAGNDVIAGASGLTYQPTAADLGKAVKVTFTGTRPGYADATTTTGTVTVTAGDPATASAAPTIAGKPQVGQVLTASPGTWSASGLTYAYQWTRSGTAIAGATAATYKAAAADAGKAVAVTVTATRTGYQSGSATSTAVKVKRVSTMAISVPKAIVAGKKATITGVVKIPGVAGPTGKVTLLDGKKAIGSVVLKATSKGKVKIVVKKLKAGKHQLRLSYGGTADTVGATTKVVKVTVTKPKKGKHRLALPRLSPLF